MDFSINAVTRRRLFQGAAAMLATLASSRTGFGDTGHEERAKAVVGRLVDHVLRVISTDDAAAGTERRLMAAIESQTDLSLLARMTMGRYWRRADSRQRTAFEEVFRRYLLQNFVDRLRRYTGTDLNAARDRFVIVGTRAVGRGDVLVHSRIEQPSGTPLKVDWRLRSREDRLVIIDLVVEGVSLLITQRSEFSSVLERLGVDGLIRELQKRVLRAA